MITIHKTSASKLEVGIFYTWVSHAKGKLMYSYVYNVSKHFIIFASSKSGFQKSSETSNAKGSSDSVLHGEENIHVLEFRSKLKDILSF